jgi:chemotaxis response regulator CheB
MPTDSGMAFVLIQHLDPQRASMLVELLATRTAKPVVEAADGLPVAAKSVFLVSMWYRRKQRLASLLNEGSKLLKVTRLLVEPDGIEPTTSSMPLKRSPN